MAKDPDALKFKLWQSPTTKKHPEQLGTHELTAVHPSKGPVGKLQYIKREDHLQVETLRVPRVHRGNGYAGHLMDEMQRRHPGTPINHGHRTDDGQDWWDSYSAGKTVTDGRTMATRRTAADHPFIHVSPREFKPGDRIEPADDHGGASTFDYSDLDRVYLSHPDHAEYWGNTVGTAGGHHEVHHYEVEPHDHPEFQFSSDGEEEYTSSGATVKRKLRTQKVDPRAYTRERIHPSLLAGGEGWAKEHDRGESQYAQRVPSWERKGAVRKCPCGTSVVRDGDEWVHADGSISHDGKFYDKSVSELMKGAARQEIDEHSAERGQGAEWRDSLPPEHDDLVQAWERAPGEVGTGKTRNQFRKIISTAPEVQGPVYRGDQPKGCFYKSDFEKKHQPGHAVNFPRWSSTSTRPEVAAGFGRVVYEIHDHGARAIGNTLHEGVMPPGKYRVHSAEWRKAPTRAAIDGRTMHDSEHLHVVLNPAESKGAARREPHERLFGRTYGLDHRLFEGEHLRPVVRAAVLAKFDDFATRHGCDDWRSWGRLVFFGSEASEWTSATLEGNGDFDLSFGIDYPVFRKSDPGSRGMTDAEIAQEFTDRMHAELNDPNLWLAVPSTTWPQDQNSMSHGLSSSTSQDEAPPALPRGQGSRSRPSAGPLPSPGSIGETTERRSVHSGRSAVIARSISDGLSTRSSRPLTEGFATTASGSTSAPGTSRAGTGSASSSTTRSLHPREAGAPSATGMTSNWSLTTITPAVRASEGAGSVSEESSALGAIRRSATSESGTSFPLSTTSADGPPSIPLPEGWVWAGPLDQTWFCNEQGYDIAAIKPYAAYDVGADSWIVKPPHLPDWDISQFPEGHPLVQEAHAVASYVRAVLKFPEPFRSQQATALWEHLHSDRGRAFGPQGEGWYDPGNVLEKFLDQLGLWQKLVDARMQAREHPEMLDAPEDWSNDPHGLMAGHS